MCYHCCAELQSIAAKTLDCVQYLRVPSASQEERLSEALIFALMCDHSHFCMEEMVLDDLIIEQLDLGIVLLDVTFDLPMHPLQMIQAIFFPRSAITVISSVH